MEKGYIQLYTGNGKGKTTAAIGQAFRASGHGLKTLMIQFMKGDKTSECIAAEKNKYITIERYGMKEFYHEGKSDILQHRNFAKKGYDRATEILHGKDYDIIILDEIINALNCNLLTYEEITALIQNKPQNLELILTGRNAPTELYDHCDLVTQFNEIKHYFNNGIAAREGIEY